MGKHRKWFWISGLYDYKLLNAMILSGTHCIFLVMPFMAHGNIQS